MVIDFGKKRMARKRGGSRPRAKFASLDGECVSRHGTMNKTMWQAGDMKPIGNVVSDIMERLRR